VEEARKAVKAQALALMAAEREKREAREARSPKALPEPGQYTLRALHMLAPCPTQDTATAYLVCVCITSNMFDISNIKYMHA
jgi:hypothetical protein